MLKADLRSIGVALVAWLVVPVWAQGPAPTVVEAFDRPFLFTYGSWLNRVEPRAGGGVVLRGVNNQGGAGYNVQLDLSAHPEASLVLQARVGSQNEAKALRLLLRDESGRSGTWDYPLADGPRGELQTIYPAGGASLTSPHAQDQGAPPDLAQIRQLQIMGDWAGGKVLSVELDALLLLSPTAELRALRVARRLELAEQARQEQRTRDAARAQVRHTPDGPWVAQVGPAAPDLLALTLQAGTLRRFDRKPYEPQPGDSFAEADTRVWAWKDGVMQECPADRILVRSRGGQEHRVGFLVGGRAGPPDFLPAEQVEGDPLLTLTADDPASYRIRSPDDPSYREEQPPLAVYRKSKPNNQAQPNKELAVRHVLYLRLAKELREGCTYEIALSGLNTRQEHVTYVHRSRQVRSEAIHVSQIGYRPDDPYKQAFLSLWLGNGGGTTFPDADRFLLLDDATGRPVYGGDVELVMAVDGTEPLRVKKNYSQTAVYRLDFSAFTKPGVYRMTIPGLGCSDPFPIRDDVWLGAFRTSMLGFLHQRSGIELGPPLTPYRRPRNLHPSDGVQVYASTASLPQANAAEGGWFEALVAGRTPHVLTHAWGGYADAGDFDRRYQHLWATYLHLELFDCFPETLAKLKLSVPATEATNAVPDLLDEALWNIDFFRRLQEADGGVRGGVESSAHPRAGETSWEETLVLMAYAPDPVTSYLFAACAARASRLLAAFDGVRAQELMTCADRAWGWAEAQRSAFAETVPDAARNELRHARATAAVEFLWITGADRYHRAFQEESVLRGSRIVPVIEQQGAVFAYARLPEGRGLSVIKDQARAAILETADQAIVVAEGNAFGLTTEIRELPEIGPVGYFTTPGMISRSTPRAHFLSGEAKYLVATLRACNFSAGANPDNLTFTTGVGVRWPQAPLHIDSRMSHQDPPAGLTVYGASDPARFDESSAWVHTWVLRGVMEPDSRQWPATEAYVDLYLWPMMNEFTMHQTLGPTSYTWGYLAARRSALPEAGSAETASTRAMAEE